MSAPAQGDPVLMASAIAAAAEIAKHANIFVYDENFQAKAKFQVQQQRARERSDSVISEVRTEADDINIDHQDEEEHEEDAEKRLARSRERNREHARRTRLRKKAQLEALQERVQCLEYESCQLKQSVQDCSIASILVGLSSSSSNSLESQNNQEAVEILLDDLSNVNSYIDSKATSKVSLVVGGKRKRFVSQDTFDRPTQPLKLNIDGRITLIGGGKTHINWKSGVYCDENGMQQQLTQDQLESLRRERNRMHAKMTRDRKKGFIAAVEKTIEQLETENKRMRDALSKVVQHHFGTAKPFMSPGSSPLFTSLEPSVTPEPVSDDVSLETDRVVNGNNGSSPTNIFEDEEQRKNKRPRMHQIFNVIG